MPRNTTVIALALAIVSCEHSTSPMITGPALISMTGTLTVGLHASFSPAPVILDSAGKDITNAVHVQWTSSNTAIATVSDAGVIFGVALGGPATITGSSGGVSASATVTVVAADIVISPPVRGVALNLTQQLTALPRDFFGAPIDAPVVWASLNPDVATIDPHTGLLTAVGIGTAIISAAAAGSSGSVGFYVDVPSPLDGLYDSEGSNDATEVRVFLGRIADFSSSFHVLGCLLSISEHPDATISNASLADSTVAAIPRATFTSSDGSTIVNAAFANAGTVSGTTIPLTRPSQPCTNPPGSTNPQPYFAVRQ